MHIPAAFKQENQQALYQLIQDHPLATLVTSTDDELDACHIPFHLNQSDGDKATLQGHVAKANNVWKNCRDGQQVLLVFHGPNSYISPNFYPSKKVAGKAVPTWNYSVVHVKGRIRFHHDAPWVLQLLNNLTDSHEAASQEKPWSVSDAPPSYIEQMIKAVVGVEIEIDRILGNAKLSQNKTAEDYAGVIDGLTRSSKPSDNSVAALMNKTQ